MSVIKHKIIHFDSIDAIQIYDNTFNLSHCYKIQMKLPSVIRKLKNIELLAIELPLQFYNIRNSNLSDTLTFKFTYSSYTNISVSVVVPNQSYTNITTLLTALNTAVTTAITSYVGLTFNLSVSPTYSSRVLLTSNASSLTFTSGILINNILGNLSTDVLGAGISTFTNNYNLNPDNYLNMNIENLPISTNNASGKQSTFKIPLNATTGQIMFFENYNGFIQRREINDDHFVLDKLIITMYDRWGYKVYPNGGDWSVSFKFEHE